MVPAAFLQLEAGAVVLPKYRAAPLGEPRKPDTGVLHDQHFFGRRSPPLPMTNQIVGSSSSLHRGGGLLRGLSQAPHLKATLVDELFFFPNARAALLRP